MVDKGSAEMETEKIVLPYSDDEDYSANEANNSDSEAKRHGKCQLSDDQLTSRQQVCFINCMLGYKDVPAPGVEVSNGVSTERINFLMSRFSRSLGSLQA